MEVRKVFISLMLLVGLLPLDAKGYESCQECVSDHQSVCSFECADAADGPDCEQHCGQSKCREFCDPAFDRSCRSCREEVLESCAAECRKKFPEDQQLEGRRSCTKSCIEQRCMTSCSAKPTASPQGAKGEQDAAPSPTQ